MTQEGTIANLGTPEQVIFDFGEVIRPLVLIDANHPLIDDLDKWREVMIANIAKAPSQGHLDDASGIVSDTLAFVAAMNRPMLMGRFRIYAGPVLTKKELQEHVLHPQIRYDFDQLSRVTDDPDVIAEIQRYLDLCLDGVFLAEREGVTSSVLSLFLLDLLRGMCPRPLLQERLHRYLMAILPPAPPVVEADSDDPDDDYAVSVVSQRAFIGGLLPTFLDPPTV